MNDFTIEELHTIYKSLRLTSVIVGDFLDFDDLMLKIKGRYDSYQDKDDEPIVNVDYESMTIDEFQYSTTTFLPVRAHNCLKSENINTIKQLLGWCEHRLLKTPNLGPKSLKDIVDFLQTKGLKLGSIPGYDSFDAGGLSSYSKCYSCKKKESA